MTRRLLLVCLVLMLSGCSIDKGEGVIVKVNEESTIVELKDGSRIWLGQVWGEEGDTLRIWRHVEGAIGYRPYP